MRCTALAAPRSWHQISDSLFLVLRMRAVQQRKPLQTPAYRYLEGSWGTRQCTVVPKTVDCHASAHAAASSARSASRAALLPSYMDRL
jgi:hypothetical protein